MRIARYSIESAPRYGFVIYDETAGRDYLVELDGHPLLGGRVTPTGHRVALDDESVRLLAPVIPSKIYGVAGNYAGSYTDNCAGDIAGNAPTLRTPQWFMKPSTSVIGPDDPIVIPDYATSIHIEPEVAVVIGKIAHNIDVSHAFDYVLGYTCANDVTAYGIEGEDGGWTKMKCFDTSCPLGPWIETEFDWQDAAIAAYVNGERLEKACGTTSELTWGIAQLVTDASRISTLLPGDVILTGTPDPSGEVVARDEARVSVEGIGWLRNTVL